MKGISKRERNCRWEDDQKPELLVGPATNSDKNGKSVHLKNK